MRKKRLLIAAAILTLASLSYFYFTRSALRPPPDIEWVRRIDDVLGCESAPLFTDSEGNVYLVEASSGYVASNDRVFGFDTVVRKFAPDGQLVWKKTVAKRPWGSLAGGKTGPNGIIYIPLARQSYKGSAFEKIRILRIKPDGSLLPDMEVPMVLYEGKFALDRKGNIFIAGGEVKPKGPLVPCVARFSPDGRCQYKTNNLGVQFKWHAQVDSLAPDSSGGAYFSSTTTSLDGWDVDSASGRIDSAGKLTWTLKDTQFGPLCVSPGRGLYSVGDKCADAPHHCPGLSGVPEMIDEIRYWFAARRYFASGLQNVFVDKYDQHGKKVWSTSYATHSPDFARASACDDQGCVYVAVQTTTGANSKSMVIKYDKRGNMVWKKQLAGFEDTAYEIAADGKGNIYLYLPYPRNGPRSPAIMKLRERQPQH